MYEVNLSFIKGHFEVCQEKHSFKVYEVNICNVKGHLELCQEKHSLKVYKVTLAIIKCLIVSASAVLKRRFVC